MKSAAFQMAKTLVALKAEGLETKLQNLYHAGVITAKELSELKGGPNETNP